jgi:Pyridoxamine 5'-phosphate oxidase
MSEFAPTERTQVKRLPNLGKYDRKTVHQILDCGIVCHVGFNVESQPYVIPTNYGRKDDTLYIHGSAASRMLRTLSGGFPVRYRESQSSTTPNSQLNKYNEFYDFSVGKQWGKTVEKIRGKLRQDTFRLRSGRRRGWRNCVVSSRLLVE